MLEREGQNPGGNESLQFRHEITVLTYGTTAFADILPAGSRLSATNFRRSARMIIPLGGDTYNEVFL